MSNLNETVGFVRHGIPYKIRKYKLDLVEKYARERPGERTPKMLDFAVSQRDAPHRRNAIGVNALNAFLEVHPWGQSLVREGLIASPGGKRIAGWVLQPDIPEPPKVENALTTFVSGTGIQIQDPQRLAEYTQVQQSVISCFQSTSLTPGSAFQRMSAILDVINTVYRNLDERDDLISDMREDMQEDRSTIRALSAAAKITDERLKNYEQTEALLLARRQELEADLRSSQDELDKLRRNPRINAILNGEGA